MKKQKEIKIKSPKEISDDALVRKISTWLAGWLIFAAIGAFVLLFVITALIWLKVI